MSVQMPSPAAVRWITRRFGRPQRRTIIAIAGPPASGKSTLTETLATALAPHVAVLAMDGFHLSNAALAKRGLSHRKGAPETFDVEGFTRTLMGLRAGRAVALPAFDRARDCVIPNAARYDPRIKLVIVEGNYLLLREPPWTALQRFWDFTVFLDVPPATLRQRLEARWAFHGRSDSAARAWIESNDLPNAQRVIAGSTPADLRVTLR